MRPHHLASDLFFFFNDTATTEIYTLSLHDALPICIAAHWLFKEGRKSPDELDRHLAWFRQLLEQLAEPREVRSEEHTSELQSQSHLVCRLLLEKQRVCVPRWWYLLL